MMRQNDDSAEDRVVGAVRLSVCCPKCEAEVFLPPEWQTPTIPPMVPNIPTLILLRNIGHTCELADIVKVLSRV